MRAGLRLSGNLCRSPPVNRLKAGLANDGAQPNRPWTGVKSCPLFRTRRQAHSTAIWLEEGWPRLRAQSHSSRNCLTANSVTHLSGRFLRLGKSIMGEPKRSSRQRTAGIIERWRANYEVLRAKVLFQAHGRKYSISLCGSRV